MRVLASAHASRESFTTLCFKAFMGVLLRFQTAFQLLPERPVEAKEKLGGAIEQAAEADHGRPGCGSGIARFHNTRE